MRVYVRIDSETANGKIIIVSQCKDGKELASMLTKLITKRQETTLVIGVPMKWFALELEISHTAENVSCHVH